MPGNESNISTKDNPLVRAFARWEGAGGRARFPPLRR
jgi:hypothetical protein